VWSRGLGRVELGIDLRKARVYCDGSHFFITGKTEPPVTWDFVMRISVSEAWIIAKILLSGAVRKYILGYLSRRLFNRKVLKEELDNAVKTRTGIRPEVEYAVVLKPEKK
jgi:hypothetical protein